MFVNGPYCCLLNSTDLRALADTKLICGPVELRHSFGHLSWSTRLTGLPLTSGTFKNCTRDRLKGQTAFFALDFNCSIWFLKQRTQSCLPNFPSGSNSPNPAWLALADHLPAQHCLPAPTSPPRSHHRQLFYGLHQEHGLRRWRGKESWQREIYFLHRLQARRWDKYILWEYTREEAAWVMPSEVNNTGASDLKAVKWILPTISFTVIKIISLMFLLIYPIWLNNLLFVITGEEVIFKKACNGLQRIMLLSFCVYKQLRIEDKIN